VFELGLDEQAMLLRAIEDKVFTPMGSDREVSSEFQLICGTNRDLFEAAASGTFRDDLLARIDLWTFTLPSLRERLEDLEPNLDHETERVGRGLGVSLTWAREARDEYLRFSTSPEATWPGNFRDLNASVTRLGTLAEGGRITRALVREEITRLRGLFSGAGRPRAEGGRGRGREDASSLVERLVPDPHLLDRFDRVQLEEVLSVCASTRSLGEAGRVLFSESRKKKGSVNDSDRVRKYLARYGLELGDVHEASRRPS
jgi:transcriptional regulatory protein RtcR